MNGIVAEGIKEIAARASVIVSAQIAAVSNENCRAARARGDAECI